jgi:Leucine-rich repeat (LRR) protein
MIIITEICLMPPKYRVVNLAGKILCYTTNFTYKSIRKQLSTVINFRDRNTIDFAIRLIDNDEILIVFKELKGFDSIPDDELFSNKLSLKPSEFIDAVLPGIGYLVNLTHLTICFLYITELPHEIRKLINLEHLDISDNKLTDLPTEIGKLINLEYLDISYNKLTDLPMSLKKLKKLNSINITYNMFPSIPYVINKLISLKTLNVYEHIYRTADYLDSIIKFKLKKPHLAIN